MTIILIQNIQGVCNVLILYKLFGLIYMNIVWVRIIKIFHCTNIRCIKISNAV